MVNYEDYKEFLSNWVEANLCSAIDDLELRKEIMMWRGTDLRTVSTHLRAMHVFGLIRVIGGGKWEIMLKEKGAAKEKGGI